MKNKIINEMPHIYSMNRYWDLNIEKYPIDKNEKIKLFNKLNTIGVFAYSNKLKTWLLFTNNNIKKIKKQTDITLPEYWESYIIIKK